MLSIHGCELRDKVRTRIRNVNVRENVLLNEINKKLDEARNLAIEAGGFTLFYLIEMASLEAAQMSKKHKALWDDARRMHDLAH